MKDIAKDRFCVVLAGTSFFAVAGERMVNRPAVPVVIVPADPAKDMEPGRYPHERRFRLVGEMLVGTVDEIVAYFRHGLVRSYQGLVCAEAGADAVIPTLGTSDCRPQHDAIGRYYDLLPESFLLTPDGQRFEGGATIAQVVDVAPARVFSDRESRRASIDEHTYQQKPSVRLAVHEALAAFHQRVSAPTPKGLGDMLEYGNASSLRVAENLTSALHAYRADLETVKANQDRQYAARRAAEVKVPEVKGCARCGGDHPDVTFTKFKQPHESGGEVYTHWAWCPNNHEPIMMKFEPDEADAAVPVAAPAA